MVASPKEPPFSSSDEVVQVGSEGGADFATIEDAVAYAAESAEQDVRTLYILVEAGTYVESVYVNVHRTIHFVARGEVSWHAAEEEACLSATTSVSVWGVRFFCAAENEPAISVDGPARLYGCTIVNTAGEGVWANLDTELHRCVVEAQREGVSTSPGPNTRLRLQSCTVTSQDVAVFFYGESLEIDDSTLTGDEHALVIGTTDGESRANVTNSSLRTDEGGGVARVSADRASVEFLGSAFEAGETPLLGVSKSSRASLRRCTFRGGEVQVQALGDAQVDLYTTTFEGDDVATNYVFVAGRSHVRVERSSATGAIGAFHVVGDSVLEVIESTVRANEKVVATVAERSRLRLKSSTLHTDGDTAFRLVDSGGIEATLCSVSVMESFGELVSGVDWEGTASFSDCRIALDQSLDLDDLPEGVVLERCLYEPLA